MADTAEIVRVMEKVWHEATQSPGYFMLQIPRRRRPYRFDWWHHRGIVFRPRQRPVQRRGRRGTSVHALIETLRKRSR